MPSILTPSAQSARPNVHVVPSANRTILPSIPVAKAAPGVRVRLTAAVLSTIDYEPVVRVLPLLSAGR
jgi:hypothetical protein